MKKVLQLLFLSYCSIPLTISSFSKLPNAFRQRFIMKTNSRMNLIMQQTGKNSDSPFSGVYEFAGKGIPPEFRKLLGQKEDKKNTNKQNVIKKNAATKKKIVKSTFQDGESLDDLEKDLLSKYGSMPLKGTDWDEDDDDMAEKSMSKKTTKFDGFNPLPKASITTKSNTVSQLSEVTSKSSKISIKSQITPSTIDSKENRAILSETLQMTPKAKGIFSNRRKIEVENTNPSPIINNNKLYADDILLSEIDDDDDDYNINENKKESENGFGIYKKPEKLRKSVTSGEEANTVTFRLRPPPPMSTEQIVKAEKKKSEMEAKEIITKEKKEKMKLADANSFTPFTFNNDESNKLISEQLFTVTSFADLGINNEIVIRNLERMNIYNPTNIQDIAIRALLTGKDIVMQAQTGSGKTLAFLLPLLNVVDPKIRKVQAMIIAPSRELVTQIAHVGETVFKGTGIQVMPLIGGANVRFQIEKLRDDRPQILVATPGRLAEIVFRLEKLRLGMVRAVIVDEVDNLLREPYVGELETLLEATPLFKRNSLLKGMGGSSISKNSEEEDIVVDELYDTSKDKENVKKIDSTINISKESAESESDSISDNDTDTDTETDSPKMLLRRLVCLSSATGNSPLVAQFASRLCGPEGVGWTKVAVDSASKLPASITHGLISVPRIKAIETLKKILNSRPTVTSALIFVNDPHRVEVLCEKLLEMKIISAPLHGDSSKDDRKEVIARLRSGRIGIVVTTELAARGLDFPDLTHVINFELPTDSEHYVHRAGRCGRAGRSGLVLNFATPETKFVIRRFGKQLGVQVLDCELRDGQIHLKGR